MFQQSFLNSLEINERGKKSQQINNQWKKSIKWHKTEKHKLIKLKNIPSHHHHTRWTEK